MINLVHFFLSTINTTHFTVSEQVESHQVCQ